MNEHLAAMPEVSQSIAKGKAGVSCAHPLAAKAGIECLKKGGNAFDAILATALTLTVVEPTMSGMLGAGLAMLNPIGEKAQVCNFSGRIPMHFSLKIWLENANKALSPFVPEAIQGWLSIHKKYGSLPFKTLCEPAIHYAKNGFTLSEANVYFLNLVGGLFPKHLFPAYYKKLTYQAGDTLIQTQTAVALEALANHQMAILNQNAFIDPLRETFEKYHCFLCLDDLVKARAEWEAPLIRSLFGYNISVPSSNSDGIVVVDAAEALEKLNISQYKHNSAEYIDSVVTILKQTLDKHQRWIGAPKHFAQDTHLVKQHTTSLLTKDTKGNSIILTQTLGGLFGDGLWVEELGLPLNGLGSYSYPNNEKQSDIFDGTPGARIPWPVSMVAVFKEDTLQYMFATPGGFSICQTELQILLNVLVFNMSLADAIAAPRFFIDERLDISMERRIGDSVIETLAQKGYKPVKLGDYSWKLGCMQGLDATSNQNVFIADPRRHAIAISI